MMACVDGDGTETNYFRFHWELDNSKMFQRKTGSELGFHNHHNSKSQMKSTIFWNGGKNIIHILGGLEVKKYF